MKRNTWQRDAVATALTERAGFVSAQALHATLVARGDALGLATVYRALAALVDDGRADVLASPDGESLYRACSISQHHHHLICRECGTTEEIEAHDVENWAKTVASAHGYVDAHHVVDVFGVCPGCAGAR